MKGFNHHSCYGFHLGEIVCALLRHWWKYGSTCWICGKVRR